MYIIPCSKEILCKFYVRSSKYRNENRTSKMKYIDLNKAVGIILITFRKYAMTIFWNKNNKRV